MNSTEKTSLFAGLLVISMGLVGFLVYHYLENDGFNFSPETRDAEAIFQECRQDLECAADRAKKYVGKRCRQEVEEFVLDAANHEPRWDLGFMSAFWEAQRWEDGPGGNVQLVGDNLSLQNSFGVWTNYIYICTVNISTRTFVSVELVEGRLRVN